MDFFSPPDVEPQQQRRRASPEGFTFNKEEAELCCLSSQILEELAAANARIANLDARREALRVLLQQCSGLAEEDGGAEQSEKQRQALNVELEWLMRKRRQILSARSHLLAEYRKLEAARDFYLRSHSPVTPALKEGKSAGQAKRIGCIAQAANQCTRQQQVANIGQDTAYHQPDSKSRDTSKDSKESSESTTSIRDSAASFNIGHSNRKKEDGASKLASPFALLAGSPLPEEGSGEDGWEFMSQAPPKSKAAANRPGSTSSSATKSWAKEPEEGILTPLWHLGMDLNDLLAGSEDDCSEATAIESF